ncbi:TPA: glutaredoxin, partial [Listeria monocytogenes]|nr:glutaredoxin [Listeria monocytogenes]
MANVVVWSKVGCHYCKDVKDYLTEQKIVFQDIDVTDHDYLREVLQAK